MTGSQISSISNENRCCFQRKERVFDDARIIDKTLGITIFVIGIIMSIGGIIILSMAIPSTFNIVAGAVVLGSGICLGILSIYLLSKKVTLLPESPKDTYFYFEKWLHEMEEVIVSKEQPDKQVNIKRCVREIRRKIQKEEDKAKGIVRVEDDVDGFLKSCKGKVKKLLITTGVQFVNIVEMSGVTTVSSVIQDIFDYFLGEGGKDFISFLGRDYKDLVLLMKQSNLMLHSPDLQEKIEELQKALEILKQILGGVDEALRQLITKKIQQQSSALSEAEVEALDSLEKVVVGMAFVEKALCDLVEGYPSSGKNIFIFKEEDVGKTHDPHRRQDTIRNLQACQKAGIDIVTHLTLTQRQIVKLVGAWRILCRCMGKPESNGFMRALAQFKMVMMFVRLQ